MDRELLFRGKSLENGEWVESHGIMRFCDGIYKLDTIDRWMMVDPKTIGQYTGQTVKTGEVFQDDICRNIDGVFFVCWDDEKAAFMMQFLNYPHERLYLEEMWEDSEVIGNIHDNPELMGGEEDG